MVDNQWGVLFYVSYNLVIFNEDECGEEIFYYIVTNYIGIFRLYYIIW